MSSLAFFSGSLVFIINGIKHHFPLNKLLGLVALANISAVIGSRLLFVLNNISQFQSHPRLVFAVTAGGYAFYGGFLFTFSTLVIYLKLTRLPFWETLDIGSPAVAIGMIINKMGCFLAGCCYGMQTALSIGVQFPEYSIPALKYGFPHSIHASQLYASLLGFLILVVLLRVEKSKHFSGQVFLCFLIIFSLERWFNLTRRGDIDNELLFGIPQSQLWGFVFLLLAAVSWFILSRKKKRY